MDPICFMKFIMQADAHIFALYNYFLGRNKKLKEIALLSFSGTEDPVQGRKYHLTLWLSSFKERITTIKPSAAITLNWVSPTCQALGQNLEKVGVVIPTSQIRILWLTELRTTLKVHSSK